MLCESFCNAKHVRHCRLGELLDCIMRCFVREARDEDNVAPDRYHDTNHVCREMIQNTDAAYISRYKSDGYDYLANLDESFARSDKTQVHIIPRVT